MNVPWIRMPSVVAVAREPARPLDADALLDVLQDLLVAGLVADQEQAEAVVLEDLQRLAVDVGVGRPGDAELPEPPRDRLRARRVVGEGVVVEEELLHLREEPASVRDLVDHVLDRARAVAVAAARLRPEAEGALRAAAATGVERDVGMQQVPDEVVLDLEVALVDVDHERQPIHLLQRRAVGRAMEASVGAVGQARDPVQRPPLGDRLDGEVELGAPRSRSPARRRAPTRARRPRGRRRSRRERWVRLPQRLGHLHVGAERRRARVEHDVVVVPRQREHVVERQVERRGVEQPRAGHQRGGLGEPRGIPERPDLASRLVAGAGAAVEVVERGRIQEQRPQAVGHPGHLS